MIKVSDHAVVRYLERHQGVDVEAIRETIASSLDCRSARKLVEFSGGAPCKIRVDGMTYCVRQNTVTTCLRESGRRQREGRRHRGRRPSVE